MIEIQMKADGIELLRMLCNMAEEANVPDVSGEATTRSPKRQGVLPEQAAALALLAHQYDRSAAHILEIGTSAGYTAAIMKLAAPQARVVTLEPDRAKRAQARVNLEGLDIDVRPYMSAVYLELLPKFGFRFNLIFVDGDHKHVSQDLPYFNFLKVGGLFLFHDYSPETADHPCPPVYDALNGFGEDLGRGPDVLIQSEDLTGMAGWYKKSGEVWPPEVSSTSEPATS